MASPTKKTAEAGTEARKSIPYRANGDRWKELSLARIEQEISFQELMDRALDEYLAKHKSKKKGGN